MKRLKAGNATYSRFFSMALIMRATAFSSGQMPGMGKSICFTNAVWIHPGQMVVVDQLVDRTWGRPDTFHDRGAPGGPEVALHHQAFADPYHAGVRDVLVRAARECAVDVVDGGVMVVINGPRFSTRAESTWFRQMGWHVVNMTGYPEAVLAAEAGLRYASIALVTDRDASDGGGVTMDEVFEMIRANVTRVTAVIGRAVTDHHDELVGIDERTKDAH